jgi:hypothetical protein
VKAAAGDAMLDAAPREAERPQLAMRYDSMLPTRQATGILGLLLVA